MLEPFDHALRAWLTSVPLPWLDAPFTWFELNGGAWLLWIPLAIAAFVRRQDRAAAWRMLLAIGLSYLVAAGILKPLVDRPRPVPLNEVAAAAGAEPRTLPPMPTSPSFPSDRATAAAAAALTVSRMWPAGRVVWWLFAALVIYERVYVGHHYPLDVIAGAIIGVLIGYWVVGGRHPATDARTLARPLPADVLIRP